MPKRATLPIGRWYFEWFLIFILSSFIYGCTTNQKCSDVDWRTLGESDGSRGYFTDSFNRHLNSCEKGNSDLDAKAAYDSGYTVGIAKFCTWKNGWNQRFMDRPYCGQCPKELEREFLLGYSPSKTRFQLQEDANDSIHCGIWRGD